MERLVCPKCGEPIGHVARIRRVIGSCPKKELFGQCSCGEKYSIRDSRYGLVLSFPDREITLAC